MAFKFVVLAAFVACVSAGNIAPVAYSAPLAVAKVAAPVLTPVAKIVDTEFDPNPQYSFAYDIQDHLTGDSKSQHESRSGDLVQGQYSLIEADGTRRIVDYTADDVNGFNAIVRKEGLAIAAAPVVAAEPVIAARVAAPVVAKVAALPAARLAYPAPLTARIAAPLAYSAPLAYNTPIARLAAPVHYAAPLAYHSAPLAYSASLAAAPLAYSAPIAKVAAPLAYQTYIH